MEPKKIMVALLLLPMTLLSQEVLTLEEAVKTALANNYDIRIAANELRIDSTQVTIGNAGFLPRVEAIATDNNSIQNSSQTRQTGEVITLDNARNNSLNYGVNLGWTIFDGFGMFARYDQLKETRKLGEAELRVAMTAGIGDLMGTYFDLVQQQQQLAALDTAIVISRQRVETAQNRYTIGKAAKLEVLNAQVDLNTDITAQLRQQETFATSRVRLNELMGRDPQVQFRVSDSITVDSSLVLADLINRASEQNPQIQAQVLSKRIAELQLRQVRAGRYPVVTVNTGYIFTESESSLGFTTEASSRGFSYGFNATLNLFDGFNQRRNEKVAKLQVENADLFIERQKLAIGSQVTSAYQTYRANVSLIDIERRNQELAKENLRITLDKFRIGTVPTLEFRTAQLNYINARARFYNAQYQAKLSEITLRELSGSLGL